MDFGSAIIGAIVIAICIGPFIIMGRIRKNVEKNMLQSLANTATQHNCQITQHEIIKDMAIGIDETKKFVFFYRKLKEKVEEKYIDLAGIQSCKVVRSNSAATAKDSASLGMNDRLELSFISVDKNKPPIALEFFNAEINIQLSGELQSAEKWSKLINNLLKKS